MQERHEFDHESDFGEDLETEEKVRKLWRDRELRIFLRKRRMDLLKIWGGCLTAAVSAATFISMIIGGWKK